MKLAKTSLLFIFFSLLLTNSISSYASPVPVSLQFKNDNAPGEPPIMLTKPAFVDFFDWSNSNPEYKAVWNLPGGDKSIKDVAPQKIELASGQSISAALSYRWNDKWYGLSQYAFNYANRPKEYGCFVTEVRVSGLALASRNYNSVIAAYRQDPQHLDDYLTCYAEKNSNTSFTIHMSSSKTKVDEKNMTDDSKRYNWVGDTDRWPAAHEVDQPVSIWKDDVKNEALVITMENSDKTPIIIRPQPLPPYDFFYRIQLINNTDKVLVAGEPVFNNWKNFKASTTQPVEPAMSYYFSQPQHIEPGNKNPAIILNTPSSSEGVAVRVNYHFEGSAESSGCYIIATSPHPYYHFNQSETAISTFYRFDPTHADKNLYCFISVDGTDFDNSFKTVKIVLYDNTDAIKEVKLPQPTSLYNSYFNIYRSPTAWFNATYDTGETVKSTAPYNKYIPLYTSPIN